MSQRNKVEVKIAGKDYTLVGVESEEYMQKLALYIDKKMNGIMKANNKLSTSMAAVLTAVNVADDLFKASEKEESLSKELKRVLSELEMQKNENKKMVEENSLLRNNSTNLQMELAKREAELNEVRSMLDKATKP